MFSFCSSRSGFSSPISMNHDGIARYMIRCLLRGLKGYSCRMYSIRQTILRSARSLAMYLLLDQTSRPL